MATYPWYDSQKLIDEVKLRISLPIAQETYNNEKILKLANAVLFDSQVPSVMEYHQEFYVYREEVELQDNKVRYAIPSRAIGMRLRDVFYKDTNGNIAKLTRINPDNEDIFQSVNTNYALPYTFYIENNDVVLVAMTPSGTEGSLVFSYFLRPNNLVENERAFTISDFSKEITIDNSSLVAGDTVTVGDLEFEAVASGASDLQFDIGPSSIVSASNLVNAINDDGTYSATNGTPATAVVTITFTDRTTDFETDNEDAFDISTDIILNGDDTVPDNITNSSYVDFLQTRSGHKIYSYDVLLGNDAVSGSSLVMDDDDVPTDLIVGDYVCSAYECIIPQLPTELHSLLVERTCEKILTAQGDVELLGSVQQKIQTLEKNQGTLIDNRVDGSPQKVLNRNSLIGLGKFRNNFFG
jgi:hypothetical protein